MSRLRLTFTRTRTLARCLARRQTRNRRCSLPTLRRIGLARRVLAGGALGLGLLFGFSGPSTTLGQTVELRGTAIGGAEIFQTFLKRGPGDLRSDQHAEGENSRIEVHGVIDGSAEPSEPTPKRSKPRSAKFQLMPGSGSAAQPTGSSPASPTAKTLDRAGEGEQHATSAPERSTATASNEQLAGGHLIVRRDGENGWRALGLTQDGDKARRASKLLQSQGIEAAVFQFLPVPAEIQRLPLAPGVQPIALAVRLNGEVYAVGKDGLLVEVPLK